MIAQFRYLPYDVFTTLDGSVRVGYQTKPLEELTEKDTEYLRKIKEVSWDKELSPEERRCKLQELGLEYLGVKDANE